LETAFDRDYLPQYHIVLFLGIYHKLKDQTSHAVIVKLIQHLVSRTSRFFVIRTAAGAPLKELGLILVDSGLHRIHYSALSSVVGPVEIWQRS
jgi:hypothetical protein